MEKCCKFFSNSFLFGSQMLKAVVNTALVTITQSDQHWISIINLEKQQHLDRRIISSLTRLSQLYTH
ncbi:hypothetical protein BDF20DRAFT_880160 [Mycotypha africana]|uniref:uncharacterized protein n=1 Tax=Mycotypha africana TaxID=64632 RepID=UPI0023015725|nr:uncharacterized protein BDF20DRAFT_880160 [Mycotypha africana]KAI8975697.1 hypothetical protein BDF20DRAFT_880160 [Mycotypha africana]